MENNTKISKRPSLDDFMIIDSEDSHTESKHKVTDRIIPDKETSEDEKILDKFLSQLQDHNVLEHSYFKKFLIQQRKKGKRFSSQSISRAMTTYFPNLVRGARVLHKDLLPTIVKDRRNFVEDEKEGRATISGNTIIGTMHSIKQNDSPNELLEGSQYTYDLNPGTFDQVLSEAKRLHQTASQYSKYRVTELSVEFIPYTNSLQALPEQTFVGLLSYTEDSLENSLGFKEDVDRTHSIAKNGWSRFRLKIPSNVLRRFGIRRIRTANVADRGQTDFGRIFAYGIAPTYPDGTEVGLVSLHYKFELYEPILVQNQLRLEKRSLAFLEAGLEENIPISMWTTMPFLFEGNVETPFDVGEHTDPLGLSRFQTPTATNSYQFSGIPGVYFVELQFNFRQYSDIIASEFRLEARVRKNNVSIDGLCGNFHMDLGDAKVTQSYSGFLVIDSSSDVFDIQAFTERISGASTLVLEAACTHVTFTCISAA